MSGLCLFHLERRLYRITPHSVLYGVLHEIDNLKNILIFVSTKSILESVSLVLVLD